MPKILRAFKRGITQISFRNYLLEDKDYLRYISQMLEEARHYGAKIFVHNRFHLLDKCGARGIHMSYQCFCDAQEGVLVGKGAIPSSCLCGVSCHNLEELQYVCKSGGDFAVLGNVKATPSHPQRKGMGWEKFQACVRRVSDIPVYAIGGLDVSDLVWCRKMGGVGIAMMRAGWE